jgi:hypothetical protein
MPPSACQQCVPKQVLFLLPKVIPVFERGAPLRFFLDGAPLSMLYLASQFGAICCSSNVQGLQVREQAHITGILAAWLARILRVFTCELPREPQNSWCLLNVGRVRIDRVLGNISLLRDIAF